MITIKIDVTKITKSRLYKGQKCTYLNAKLIETPNNEYEDYMIVEQISKEEWEQGIKGAILGNGKIVNVNKPTHTYPGTLDPEVDDLPF